jgi:hypothetical protein
MIFTVESWCRKYNLARTYLIIPHEPRFGLTGRTARREPRRMVTLIRKASNNAVRPVRRNPKGSAIAGDLLRRSLLEWNDHTALLAPCTSSREGGFAAMWVYEIGSDHLL